QNKIEQDLMQITPKEKWMPLTDLLIFHGRNVCKAKKTSLRSLRFKQDLSFSLHYQLELVVGRSQWILLLSLGVISCRNEYLPSKEG
ncbi:MAG: hypothetical protein MUP41_20270, partial [Desulfobacterales bacterium]|nr:hypothetical protein [Desulfobacterales bacterium]